MCVSLTTLEATLIYSAKNGNQWTANGILFILKKLKSCKSVPSIQKQLSKLTALYRTSYGHAHLIKFKVYFEGTQEHCSYWYECWGYGVVIIFSRLCALRVSTSVPSFSMYSSGLIQSLGRFAENLQIKEEKVMLYSQYLEDQRKNRKGSISLFAFLEIARTLQTAVIAV